MSLGALGRLAWARRPAGGAASAGLLAVRLAAGATLTVHGWGKLCDPFGWMGAGSSVPGGLQALAAFAEVGGGVSWLLGLLVPVLSIGVLGTMVVAIGTQVARGDPLVGPHGYECALSDGAVAVLLMLAGPGQYAIDHVIGRAIEDRLAWFGLHGGGDTH